MPTELKGMKVDFLSLVSKGANGKKIIWKSGGEKPEGAEIFETALRKVKKSNEKRMVYGVVYSPDQIDSQGEFASRGEIEKAAYDFMKGLRLLNVDAQHDFDPKAAFVAESWITKGVDSLFEDEPEGSWAVGIRVDDEALWENVKKGELAGISMAGYAAKIRKGEEGFLAKMEELLTRLLKGTEKSATASDSDADGKGAPDGGNSSADEKEGIEKIAKALESLPALVESMSKLEGRVKELETATPGRMSKGVDGTEADDGVSFA